MTNLVHFGLSVCALISSTICFDRCDNSTTDLAPLTLSFLSVDGKRIALQHSSFETILWYLVMRKDYNNHNPRIPYGGSNHLNFSSSDKVFLVASASVADVVDRLMMIVQQ